MQFQSANSNYCFYFAGFRFLFPHNDWGRGIRRGNGGMFYHLISHLACHLSSGQELPPRGSLWANQSAISLSCLYGIMCPGPLCLIVNNLGCPWAGAVPPGRFPLPLWCNLPRPLCLIVNDVECPWAWSRPSGPVSSTVVV